VSKWHASDYVMFTLMIALFVLFTVGLFFGDPFELLR